MDDLISRQAAIDTAIEAADKWDGGYSSEREGIIRKFFDKVPSAQPATSCSEIPNGSDDTISRQAAIDALDEQIEQCNKALGSFDISPKDEYAIKVERASLKAYKEQLENMPTAQPEQRWIPMTERLPENDNEVLITVWDAEDDYVEVYKGFYQGHEWWTQWCHGCSKIKDEPCGENIAIAWMPLPEPYRGGGK